MKNIIKITLLSMIMLFITGCAAKTSITTEVVNVDESKQVRLNYYVYKTDSVENIKDISILNKNQKNFVEKVHKLKIIIKTMAEETIKNGFSHFIISEKTFGQEDGSIPINSFYGIKEYALNNELSNQKIGTEEKSTKLKVEYITWLKFKMLKNPDYKVLAMDAKEVLKEIEGYQIDMKEVSLIKD